MTFADQVFLLGWTGPRAAAFTAPMTGGAVGSECQAQRPLVAASSGPHATLRSTASVLQLLVTSLYTTVSSVVTQRLQEHLCLAAFAQLQSTLNIHMQPRITGFIWIFFFNS